MIQKQRQVKEIVKVHQYERRGNEHRLNISMKGIGLIIKREIVIKKTKEIRKAEEEEMIQS